MLICWLLVIYWLSIVCVGGVKSSNWNCYADESLYEADRVVHGDYEIDGDSDMSIAVTGGITIIRKEV